MLREENEKISIQCRNFFTYPSSIIKYCLVFAFKEKKTCKDYKILQFPSLFISCKHNNKKENLYKNMMNNDEEAYIIKELYGKPKKL